MFIVCSSCGIYISCDRPIIEIKTPFFMQSIAVVSKSGSDEDSTFLDSTLSHRKKTYSKGGINVVPDQVIL